MKGGVEASVTAEDRICREEVNMVLERARQDGFLGASLEAKVLLHVADPDLAASLRSLQGVRSLPCFLTWCTL